MQDYEQYIVEKKKENEQSSNNVQVESSYDERGYNEHGQRFRYRTTRTERDNSDSTNTRSEIRQLRRSENTSRQRNEGWGSEARSRRRSRRTPLRIGGIEKRRQVYAFNLRATSTLGRGKQRSRNITSQFYKKFQGCTHRLIPWLARDLRVLLGNNEEEVNFLMEFILSLITRIDMDSAEFVEELRPFLLQTTEHFVHELLSFAKAPFDMATYDECVVYPWPEENSRAANYPNEHTVNEERQGPLSSVVSTQPVAERTPLSQCEWSETPAGLHQVFSLQDSPIQDGESLQPGDLHQVVEISDSTDSSEKTDDEDRKPTEHSQDIVVSEENVLLGDSSSRGLSKPDECQVITCASLTHGSSSEGVEMSRTEEKLLLTSHKNTADGDEHVHRHIHTHLHKHRHKHKHKHRHKLGHSHRLKRKRHPVNPESTSEYASSVGRALSSVSRSDTDISTTQTQVPIGDSGSVFETNSVGKAHSPKLEEMRKEIDELNVQIQQHEEQLLSLNRRTET